MRTKRENPAVPAWSDDELDSPFPQEIEPPYFDEDLKAWVLSRHADVLAAFRAPGLCPASSKSAKPPDPVEEALRLDMREKTRNALSPTQLRAWREELAPEARRVVDRLPAGAPVDLVDQCARPFCLALAAIVTGTSRADAEALYGTAQPLSAAAAEPYDRTLRDSAKAANAKLHGCFHSEYETLRVPGFVALAHTMQGILANAWFALMQHPEEWARLNQRPELMEPGVEELLRYAGLARIVSRAATEDVDLNGVCIREGDRIILRIIAANHDSERFPNANQLNIARGGGGHLTLGAGPHSCVAANLIRMATVAITQPLVQRFATATPARAVEWQGGSGFRYPKYLWASLCEAHGSGNGPTPV
ncbi:MAG TPA: cytochrome P450 [Acidobacteriaceae bacterium]|nr:cytochrome P450 [Acidobacteriaceae bacterium]